MSEQRQTYAIRIDRQVPIPMRDHTILRADVYRPNPDGRWPVILMCFVADPQDTPEIEIGRYLSEHGYVFVYCNVRGTGPSGGDFYPLIHEAWGKNQDGYDTVVWAASQPWSNGNVGLLGTSYGAFNQYTTAPTRPPGLKACMPFYGSNIKDTVFPGGIYRLEDHRGWALWMALNCFENQVAPEDRAEALAVLEAARDDHNLWIWHLPVTECLSLKGLSHWHLDQLTYHGDLDWWGQTDAKTKLEEIDVPMLHIAGWYDLYLNGTLDHFKGLSANGRSEHCRRSQRLVIGPWTHGGCSEPLLPENLDFGLDAMVDFKELALQWFDRWLNEDAPELAGKSSVGDPRIRYFLMGENRWLATDEWPPADVDYTSLHFRQGTGRSAQSLNNGHLAFEAPKPDEPPDHFIYDPAAPVIGHHGSAPTIELDQRLREGQMLTYTSAPLEEPVTVVGPVSAVLYASTSAPDTDWVVRLCDVDPGGHSTRICDGILRVRYRNSEAAEALLEPDQVYSFDVDMAATAITFLPGHRIRIHVTSSDFPRYDRNLNTGEPFGVGDQGRVATNTVFHDAARPSHVILPLVRDLKP